MDSLQQTTHQVISSILLTSTVRVRWGCASSRVQDSRSCMSFVPSLQHVSVTCEDWAVLCCRYHLGSAALGSFVVALIQFVRFLLEYLEKKSKLAQAKAGVAGAFVKYIMCCVNCLMWYLEAIVRFINRWGCSTHQALSLGARCSLHLRT